MPVLLVALLAFGCGTASEPSPPSGVDELTIPTPSVDPGDFVERIDNPWLPARPRRDLDLPGHRVHERRAERRR